MKRWVTSLLSALATLPAYALPLGNIGDPVLYETYDDACWYQFYNSFGRIGVGYYGDFVHNRYLRTAEGHHDVNTTRINTNAAYFVINFFDRIDLFGTLGTTNMRLNFGSGLLGFAGDSTIETRNGFSGSAGGRIILFEWCDFGIGGEGQYFATRPRSENVSFNDSNPDDIKFRYTEWQGGLGLFYRYDVGLCWHTLLVPYAGVKWSRALLQVYDPHRFNSSGVLVADIPQLETSRLVGGAVGITGIFCDRFEVTFEGRFGDETAFFVTGQASF